MSTLQKHYDNLQQRDPKRWNALNGKLASKMYKRSLCLTYFKRSILEPEGKGETFDLSVMPYYIVKQFVEFMGFSWEDVQENRIPELATEPAELLV